MRASLLLFSLVLLAPGCGKKKPPQLLGDGTALLDDVRTRPVPDDVQARFQIRLRSKPLDLSGTTGGGLRMDRPGKGQIIIFGPIGGVLATLASDGDGASATITKDKVHYVATDGEALLREATGGAAGVDDLLAMLVGDLPFDDAPVRDITAVEDGIQAVLEGPDGVIVEAVMDPADKLPVRLTARDKQQSLLIQASYEGWTTLDGQRLPERVEVEVPAVDLSVAVRYQGWARLDEAADFSIATPEGYREASLEEAIRQGVKGLGDREE